MRRVRTHTRKTRFAPFPSNALAAALVLAGKAQPGGKLTFALANSAQAIIRQAPDAPGYAAGDTLFPFCFGLGY